MTFPSRLDLSFYMDLHDDDDVAEFDGTTSNYIIDTSWGAFTNNSAYTFEIWLQTSVLQQQRAINILRTSDNFLMFYLEQESYYLGRVVFGWDTYEFYSTGWGDGFIKSTLVDGLAHHVAVTINDTYDRARLYFDGLFVGWWDLSTYPPPSTGTCQLLLGQQRDTVSGSMSNSWNGQLYDFRFWNGVERTPEQIFESYQKRLVGSESGLATYWKLDEGTGSIANDSTSNNEDGSITGSVWTTADTHFLTEVTDYIDPANKSVKWSNVLHEALDTTGFSLEGWTGTEPEEWDEVVVYDGATRIFGGFASQIIKTEGADASVDYYIGASDYLSYLEHVVVKEEFEDSSDGRIIDMLIQEYVPWIYARRSSFVPDPWKDIEPPVEIIKTYPRIRFNRMTLRQVINQLANNAGASWYIGPNRYLYYFSTYSESAPYNLSESPDFSTTYPFYGMAVQEGGAKLVNRVEVVGGYYLSEADTTFIFAGTGKESRILMPYRMQKASDQDELQVWRNDAVKTTSYITNPKFEVNITDGWDTYENGSGGAWARSTSQQYKGAASAQITAGDGDITALRTEDALNIMVNDGQRVCVSCYAWSSATNEARIRIYDRTNSQVRKTGDEFGGGSTWVFDYLTWENNTGGQVEIRVDLENRAGDSSTIVYFDAVMCELETEFMSAEYPSAYCDGDEDDCSWSGTEENSTSSRSENAEPVWTELDVLVSNIDRRQDIWDVSHNYQEKVIEQDYDWHNMTNAAKVYGRFEVPLRTRYTDDDSFQYYGKYFDDKIVDDSIIDKKTASLRAKALLEEYSMGSMTITCHVREPGLLSGQQVHVNSPTLGINDYFLIQRVDANINVYGNVKYALSLGLWNDDLYDVLLKIYRLSQPEVQWRDDEVLDELIAESETLEMTEATSAPTGDTGPYQWNVDKWDYMTWS